MYTYVCICRCMYIQRERCMYLYIQRYSFYKNYIQFLYTVPFCGTFPYGLFIRVVKCPCGDSVFPREKQKHLVLLKSRTGNSMGSFFPYSIEQSSHKLAQIQENGDVSLYFFIERQHMCGRKGINWGHLGDKLSQELLIIVLGLMLLWFI